MSNETSVKKRKRRFGDRYDGFRVREMDPFFSIIPHIMRTRSDSQVFFEEQIDISGLREFIVENRETIPHLSTYHLFVAATLRTIVDMPRLNRFVSGRKVYSRSYLRASLSVKKSMDKDGDEAVITPEFLPTDTLADITQKFNDAVMQVKAEADAAKNETDIAVYLINLLPGFVKKFFVWLMRSLDSFGMMPKIINRVSPFHSTLFVTNVGSIGIKPVYHHLYDFGTTSIFLAIGKKETKRELQSDGTVKTTPVIGIRFVLDERICDGFYFASAIKRFKRYIKNPALLLEPPEQISEDY